jgi:hypothetical protein
MIKDSSHRQYVETIVDLFHKVVSTEGIEQSEYSPYGEPQISFLTLLIDTSNRILGATLSFYQDGRLQDGSEADVNWRATVRFDEKGLLFSDENLEPFDELYYDWSGH